MSSVTHDRDGMTITVSGLDDVSAALGDLKSKTPAAAKSAINATAREARKVMVDHAKARYAVNEAGERRLKDLVQRRKATNRSLLAELHIASFRNDLGYFDTDKPVPIHFTGRAWREGPSVWKGHVKRDEPMKELPGGKGKAKAFLAEFASGHIGMVQRVMGSDSENTTTKSGAPRWKNAQGKVEKLQTLGSPSASAMHNTVWPQARPPIERYLLEQLETQTRRILRQAEARAQKMEARV